MKFVKLQPRVSHMMSHIDVKMIATVACSVCISHFSCGLDSSMNARIFNDISPSVFKVTSIEYTNDPFSPGNAKKKINGIGTGFMYLGKDYVITNAHVVGNSMKVTVDDMDAEIVGIDMRRDIALLKVNMENRVGVGADIKPLKKCLDPTRVGDTVLALGNPLGFERSLTRGIVSGIDRTLNSETSVPLMQLIQTDASINPGNSGGPLLSAKDGCVLGVNTALVSPGASGGNAGLGFAIPMDVVDQIIDNIINQEGEQKEEVTLGVSLLPDIYSDGLGVDGVIVANVFPGGLAERIGLEGTYRDAQGRPKIGDIILEINSKKIEKLTDVYVAMQKVVKGQVLTLRILKFEGIIEVTVQT